MDVYNIITERIIEKLEAGTIPWHKPWRSIGAPRNLVSKKLYRGVNVWLLTVQGYTSPYWATMRQINEHGGHVRKGEKATPVVFWRIIRRRPTASPCHRVDCLKTGRNIGRHYGMRKVIMPISELCRVSKADLSGQHYRVGISA